MNDDSSTRALSQLPAIVRRQAVDGKHGSQLPEDGEFQAGQLGARGRRGHQHVGIDGTASAVFELRRRVGFEGGHAAGTKAAHGCGARRGTGPVPGTQGGAGRAGALGRWLSGRVWQLLGRLSYSLYLYHIVLVIPFLGFVCALVPHNLTFALLMVPFGVIAAVVCAWIMYALIEHPGVALSHRVQNRRLPGQGARPP